MHITISITSHDLSLKWDNLVGYVIDNCRIVLFIFIAEDVLSIIPFSLYGSGDGFHSVVFEGLPFLVNESLKICIIRTILSPGESIGLCVRQKRRFMGKQKGTNERASLGENAMKSCYTCSLSQVE